MEHTSKLSATEFLARVKAIRKQLDGNETYGKWTVFIMKAYNDGTPATVTAHRVSRMARNGER
jgi:hypothetical protein